MKRLIPALLALALAACGSGDNTVAATVDGTEIAVGDVESLIHSEEDVIAVEQFAQVLGLKIQWVVVEAAAVAEFDVDFTEDEVAAEADRIYESSSNGMERDEFLTQGGVTEKFLQEFARQGLISAAVVEKFADEAPAPSQEEIEAAMEEATANLTSVCVSHILVATEDEAADALERVTTGGEDFGEVAGEVSQDPGSAEKGGTYDCTPAGTYVPEFRDASIAGPIGEVHEEIVQTQFGYHVIRVDDRTDPDPSEAPTEEEAAESLKTAAAAETANEWRLEVLAAADVTVEPEYGTWSATPEPQVTPPTTTPSEAPATTAPAGTAPADTAPADTAPATSAPEGTAPPTTAPATTAP